jgi:hypothetical protein
MKQILPHVHHRCQLYDVLISHVYPHLSWVLYMYILCVLQLPMLSNWQLRLGLKYLCSMETSLLLITLQFTYIFNLHDVSTSRVYPHPFVCAYMYISCVLQVPVGSNRQLKLNKHIACSLDIPTLLVPPHLPYRCELYEFLMLHMHPHLLF